MNSNLDARIKWKRLWGVCGFATHAAGLSTHPGHARCCAPKHSTVAAEPADSGHCIGQHTTTLPSEVCHHRSHVSSAGSTRQSGWPQLLQASRWLSQGWGSTARVPSVSCSCPWLQPRVVSAKCVPTEPVCWREEDRLAHPRGHRPSPPCHAAGAYILAQAGLRRRGLHAEWNNGSMRVLSGWGCFNLHSTVPEITTIVPAL